MESKNDGPLACESRGYANYISARSAENSFAPTLVTEACAAGDRERGLPGRNPRPPAEEFFDLVNSTPTTRIEVLPGGSFRAVIETEFDASFLDDIVDGDGNLIPERAIRLFLFQMSHGAARIERDLRSLDVRLASGGRQALISDTGRRI